MNAARKPKQKTDELAVYVTFHLFNDGSIDLSERNVKETINSLFEDNSKILLKSESTNGFEMICKIDRPLLHSEKDNMLFFTKLQRLFERTRETMPHFTQVDEKDLEAAKEQRKKNDEEQVESEGGR